MTTSYSWKIIRLDCHPEHSGHSNVVFTAHWTLVGRSGELAGSAYGSQSLSFSDNVEFTPYESLTQEKVIGWVKNAMGSDFVAALKGDIERQISIQISPAVVTPPLPWA